jgi:invasion protein IalB
MPLPATGRTAAFALAAMLAAGTAQAQGSGPDMLSETYRNWIVVCRTLPAQGDQPADRLCEMTQELRQSEGNQRVLALSLRPAATAGAAELTLIVPFGLRVTELVEIRLGEATLASLPFQTCVAAGCIVRAELDASTVAILSRSDNAIVALPTLAGGQLTVTTPLDGFGPAWERLQGL